MRSKTYKAYRNKFHPNANANVFWVACVCGRLFFSFFFSVVRFILYVVYHFFYFCRVVCRWYCVLHFMVFDSPLTSFFTYTMTWFVSTQLFMCCYLAQFFSFFCFSLNSLCYLSVLQTRLKLKIKKRLTLLRIPDLIGWPFARFVCSIQLIASWNEKFARICHIFCRIKNSDQE